MTFGWLSVSRASKSMTSTSAGARGLQLRDGVVAARIAGQRGEDHAQRSLLQVLLADGQADLGGAAEQQQGLGVTDGVDHCSSNLLDMSEAKTPVGSTARRILIHSSIRGYMRVEGLGRGARVLGGVQPAAELEHPLVEFGRRTRSGPA